MSKQVWIKFFPSDWRADPALRLCSLAARGLWIELLGLMNDAEPRGLLIVGGSVPTLNQIAAIVGCGVEEVTILLDELEKNGVFSRKKNGIIYSRRMERDENKSRKNRENGEKGGNPSLCNKRKKQQSLKPHIPEAIFQKPEAIKDKEIYKEKAEEDFAAVAAGPPTKPKRKIKQIDYSPDFDEFWAEYPTSAVMSKLKTFEIWQDLSEADRRTAKNSLPAFKREISKQFSGYQPPHATTWLNQRRFEAVEKLSSEELAMWQKRLKVAREGATWGKDWGPFPNQPGCLAPHNLIEPDDGNGWTIWSVAA